MKKIISLVVIVSLMTATSVTAFAHGHRRSTATRYSVCNVQSCDINGTHRHNNRTYSAHYYGDGHDYHDYCTIEDCEVAGYHEHDGVYCFSHKLNDGHSYHRGYGHH